MEFTIPPTTISTKPVGQHVPPRRHRLRSNSGQEAFSSILAFDAQTHSQSHTTTTRTRRANTTNSLFSLRSTMETTPIKTTLACIAHVVFRHLTRTATWLRERPNARRMPLKWMVFDDSSRKVTEKKKGGVSVFQSRDSDSSWEERGQSFDFDFEEIPQEAEILQFFKTVYDTAQLEMDTLVTCLVYIERLLGVGGRRGMLITTHNWRTIVFTSLVLASKMCDDFTMWTGDFSRILGCSPQRLNELEMKFLEALQYDVNLKSSDYARYHFTLRSLAYHLSLDGGELKGTLEPLKSKAATTMSGLSELLQERTRSNAVAAANAASSGGGATTYDAAATTDDGTRKPAVATTPPSSFSKEAGNKQSEGQPSQHSPFLGQLPRMARFNPTHQRQRSESAFVANDGAPELALRPDELLNGTVGTVGTAAAMRRKQGTTYLSIDELLLYGK